jgi:hypothetical protein
VLFHETRYQTRGFAASYFDKGFDLMKNNLSTSHTAAKPKKTEGETSMRTNLGGKTALNFGCMFYFIISSVPFSS